MGLFSFLKPACCGGSDHDSRTYAEPAKTPGFSYPTLNDIPLGEWQDKTPENMSYQPNPIKSPVSSSSITSKNSEQSSVFPISSELSNFRLALEKLWSLDSNRLNPGLDYELFLHNSKNPIETRQKLFRYVNEFRILTIPTYKYFYDLMEGYLDKTEESFDNSKVLAHATDFFKAFSQTKPGQYLHQYLVAQRLCSGDPITFQKMLKDIWFQSSSRPGYSDSCAFERVFLGERYIDSIQGLHNWLYIYYKEKSGEIKYHGFVPPRHSHPLQQPNGSEHLIALKFTWNDILKPNMCSFIGTSPEFEFALYTLCFLTRQDCVTASLSGFETDIIIEEFEYNNIRQLASGHPLVK